MNKHNAKDYLPFVQALAEGKVIERKINGSFWDEIIETDFSCDPSMYRIKPEPRKAWVWWPKSESERPNLYVSESSAICKMHVDGGHITEVTE